MYVLNALNCLRPGVMFLLLFTFTGHLSVLAEEQRDGEESPVKRPYIFTQQHNIDGRPDAQDRVQLIRPGWPLQVQLPGNPAVWTFRAEDSELIEYRGYTTVYSPQRIDDTQSIFIFDFALPAAAEAGDTGVITITTAELPQSLNNVIPNGVFEVEFSVIDPD